MMEEFLPVLGVNIDHFATLRNLRGTIYPSLTDVVARVEAAGAGQITLHLREDRRHIQDQDVIELRRSMKVPMNLEMALADSVIRIAKKVRPDWACIVPEKRAELTTEGGLDVKRSKRKLGELIRTLHRQKTKVSLFIEPDLDAVRLAAELGANAVEFHTGTYALLEAKSGRSAAAKKSLTKELRRIEVSSLLARSLGVRPHAGHGLTDRNVRELVAIECDKRPLIVEYNIGHYIVCRAALVGIDRAVREMCAALHAP